MQELAWASFSLLKNSNICGLVVVWRGRAVLCRGLVGAAVSSGGGGDAALHAISSAWPPAEAALARLGSSSSSSATAWEDSSRGIGGPGAWGAYWAERGDVRGAGAAAWPFVPEGAQGLLLQPLLPMATDGSCSGGKAEGALLLLCDRPRALSKQERAWAGAIAAKLQMALSELGSAEPAAVPVAKRAL